MTNTLSRLRFVFTCIAIACLGTIASCSNTDQPLKIAAHKWPGYEFMFYAEREGLLAPEKVKLFETASASESLQALKDGKVDGAALTLDEVLRARSLGIPLQVVLVFDESAGADAVYTKKKMKKLAELKSMRIGVEEGALGALILHKLLELANLKKEDVVVVNSPIDKHLADWRAEKFDAVITYEPVSTQLDNMKAHRLIDTRKIPELVFDVLAIKKEAISNHNDSIVHLISSHFKGLQQFQKTPQDIAYRIAGHLGVNGNEVIGAYRGLLLPSQEINIKYLKKGGTIENTARTVSEIMLKNNLITQPGRINDLSNHLFIAEND